MTVRELIELLQKVNPDDEIKAYDGDSSQYESVTGILYGGKDHIVEIETDPTD